MSQENMLEVVKKMDPALYNQMLATMAEDFESIGMAQRLPKIKISHGNAIFVFPNDETTKKLEGVVLKIGTFKELYDNSTDEKKAPICASVDSPEGSKFGTCATCPHWVWGTGKNNVGRNCAESRRLLIAIKGHPQPFELKISTNSVGIIDKASATAMSTTNRALPFLNFSATLQVENKGSQSWSVIQPRFEIPEEESPESLIGRQQKRTQYSSYFADVYGKMNMAGTTDHQQNAVDVKDIADGANIPPDVVAADTPAKAKARAKAKDKAQIEDATVVPNSTEMDAIPF